MIINLINFLLRNYFSFSIWLIISQIIIIISSLKMIIILEVCLAIFLTIFRIFLLFFLWFVEELKIFILKSNNFFDCFIPWKIRQVLIRFLLFFGRFFIGGWMLLWINIVCILIFKILLSGRTRLTLREEIINRFNIRFFLFVILTLWLKWS